MAVKPRLDLEARKTANEFLDKQLRRIYLVWVIGIAAGAIEVQLDKVSFAGISFGVNSAEKLQGLIYCICVLMYFASLGLASLMMLQFISIEKDQLRQSVYRALEGKKTLLGLTRQEHKMLRGKALTYLIGTRSILLIVLVVPLAHIVFLQQPILLTGLQAVSRHMPHAAAVHKRHPQAMHDLYPHRQRGEEHRLRHEGYRDLL